MLKDNEIDQEFYDAIYDLQPSDNFYFLYRRNDTDIQHIDKKEYNAYICCFSCDGDSLDMWRYYVYNNKLQGYNIGICPWVFENIENTRLTSRDKPSCYGEMMLCRVIYDDNIKNAYYRKKIMAGYEMVKHDKHTVQQIIPLLSNQLLYTRFAFKHKCFSSEKEVRAIMLVPCEILPNMKDELYEVKYRSREGIIIPYIEVDLNETDYVEQITIAPLLHDNIAIKGLEEYLIDNGYSHVDIVKSDLPIRY